MQSTGTGADAASITFNGTGGASEDNNRGVYITGAGTTVSTVNGLIDITGQGGSNASATSGSNTGIRVDSSATIRSTGAVKATAGNIRMLGNGAAGGDYFGEGVVLQSLVEAVAGDIDITGHGHAGNLYSHGISLSGQVRTTGVGANAGNITLNGTADNATHSLYTGLTMSGPSSINTVDGDILINASGGGNGIWKSQAGNSSSIRSSGDGNITINASGRYSGISMQNAGTYIEVKDGNLVLNATALGTAGTNNLSGLSMVLGSSIRSVGVGNVTINANVNQGIGTNYGAYLTDTGTSIYTTSTGNISLTGNVAGTTGANNYGIYMLNDADIYSSGTGASAGNITLNGTGGNGTTDNYGVYNDAGITSVDGDINIIGRGGNGTGANNYGINSGGAVASTGTGASAGTITLNGTGGNGVNKNWGVFKHGGDITSEKGDIVIHANGNGTGSENIGIKMDGSKILAKGGANITIDAKASTTGNTGDNSGIHMYSAATIEAQDGGNLTINAVGSPVGPGHANGIRMFGGTLRVEDGDLNLNLSSGGVADGILNMDFFTNLIESTGTGNLTINTTNLGTANNTGINISSGTNAIRTTGSGDIFINHDKGASGTAQAVYLWDNGIVGESGSINGQNVTIRSDTGLFFSNTSTLMAADTLTVKPFSAGGSIGIGSGSGILSLTDAELARLSAGTFVFGNSTSGALSFNSVHNFTGGNLSLYGSLIDMLSAANVGAHSLLLNAQAGGIDSHGNILTADTLNLDAATSIVAAINATHTDIGSRSVGATLTGLMAGGADQAAADKITGGPGNNGNYRFENFIIRYAPAAGSPIVPVVPSAPKPPVVPVALPPIAPPPTYVPLPVIGHSIPNTVEYISQHGTVLDKVSFETDDIGTISAAELGSQNNSESASNEKSKSTNTVNSKRNDKKFRQILDQLVTLHPALMRILGIKESIEVFQQSNLQIDD